MGMESFDNPAPLVDPVEKPAEETVLVENNEKMEKLEKELKDEMEMLKYLDGRFQDISGMYDNCLKISKDPNSNLTIAREAFLSLNDYLAEKNRLQEKIETSKSKIENIEMRKNS